MITRIELDGFKTFKDFELDLGPFEVIVGANGSGKSNLFDALRLISSLASARPLEQLFEGQRGESDELFTILENDKTVDIMRLAVELLVEPTVSDSLGEKVSLDCNRLRYELKIERINKKHNQHSIGIIEESLKPILFENDVWSRKFGLSVENGWLTSPKKNHNSPEAFIYTELSPKQKVMLHLSKDSDSGERSSLAEKAESTVLASVANAEFPHVLAARQELQKWRFLQLNAEDLRATPFIRTRYLRSPDGIDLVSTLSQMQREDENLLGDVTRDLVNLVPGMASIELKQGLGERKILIQTQDNRTFSWQGLSDGTLRLLALAILRNDPNHTGLLCFEEPENGVHPASLANLAQLLRDLATDFSQPYQNGQQLQQLLVNTHSPAFISQPKIIEVSEGTLFAYVVNHIESGQSPLRVTRITPVKNRQELKDKTNANGSQQYFYTLTQVKKYLNSVNIAEAQSVLEKGLSR